MSFWRSGNVLFLILIAVALFAALSYAVTQATGGGVIDISAEKSDLDTAKQQSIQANIDGALWRLKLVNGCKDNEISYETPSGDNANPDAPADNSCHIYHPDGGGVPYVDLSSEDGEEPIVNTCIDAEPGETCNIGASSLIYAGSIYGNRIYASPSDQGRMAWGADGVITGADSYSDGLSNTNELVALGAAYAAAQACRLLGADWYLPSEGELDLLYSVRNLGAFAGTFTLSGAGASYYWSSTENAGDDHNARRIRFDNGGHQSGGKNYSGSPVRCIRSD